MSASAARRYRERHPERVKASQRRYNEKHKEKRRLQSEARNKIRSEVRANARDLFARSQGGLCPCGKPLVGLLHLDHDHACCNTRADNSCRECDKGTLHQGCNIILGIANDDPEVLYNLARYLERTRGR